MVFQRINIRQVPREVLKTAASGLGFQHLPHVNAWKKKHVWSLYCLGTKSFLRRAIQFAAFAANYVLATTYFSFDEVSLKAT